MTNEGKIKYARLEQQNAYIEAKLDGAKSGEAAVKAGYTGRHVRTPRKLIETPELKARMQESLIRKRVTLDSIADTVAKGMKAKVLSVTKEGVKETEFADHAERRKSAEVAAKLWGMTEQVKGEAGGSSITLSISGPLAERMAGMFGGE